MFLTCSPCIPDFAPRNTADGLTLIIYPVMISGLKEKALSLFMEDNCLTMSCWFLPSVQFSRLVVSDSLWPHVLQHTRLSCPSPCPGAYSNSCPSNQWRRPLLLSSSIFPSIRVFSNESVLRIRWPKYWSFSFSISPSNEYSGLISLRIDWFNLLAVQEILKSLLQHHISKTSILWRSAL